jgi:hypothetical protein
MATMQLRPRTDRRNIDDRQQLIRRVRAEFREMPCLRLTAGQAQRLFGLRPDVCGRILGELVDHGKLACGSDGRYFEPLHTEERGLRAPDQAAAR